MFGFTNRKVRNAAAETMGKIDWHIARILNNEAIYDLFLPHVRYKSNIEDWIGSALICHYELCLLTYTGTMFRDVCSYINNHLVLRIRQLIDECRNYNSSDAEPIHKKLVALNHYTGWQSDAMAESRINCAAWFMSKFTVLTGENYLVNELVPTFLNCELSEMEADAEQTMKTIRGEDL